MRSLTQVLVTGMTVFALLAVGCNDSSAPVASNSDGPRASNGDKYVLAEEPAGAKGVTSIRQDAKDGDQVVVVGRIGGNEKPWVDGRAVFWIVDPALKACGEGGVDDNCKTPWDYCCTPKEDLVKGMATVKIVDDAGQTLPTDARELLGLKELQTVVVRGTAKRDTEGNLTILASGIYRKPASNK